MVNKRTTLVRTRRLGLFIFDQNNERFKLCDLEQISGNEQALCIIDDKLLTKVNDELLTLFDLKRRKKICDLKVKGSIFQIRNFQKIYAIIQTENHFYLFGNNKLERIENLVSGKFVNLFLISKAAV